MNWLLRICTMAFAVLCLTACHHDNEVSPDEGTHTIIIYMVADNNLSDYVSSDVNEIVRAQKDIPKNCKVALYIDRANGAPYIRTLDAKEDKIAYRFPSDVVSTDSATMLSTLKRIMTLAPAEEYSLVLWSHGSGWTPSQRYASSRSFGQDGSRWMEIPTLRGVLEQFKPFNFILFDACFMQDIETAYELRHVTPWIIGSAAEIPGNGAPYHRILLDMCLKDVPAIAQHYHDYYTDPFGAVLSAIETSQLDTLAQITSRYLPQYYMNGEVPDLTGVQQYKGIMGKTEVYGMKSAMYHILGEEDYQEWVKVFDKAVPIQLPVQMWYTKNDLHTASLTDPEHYGGVAIFLPAQHYISNGYIDYWHRFDWYKAAGWDTTGW